MPSKPQVRDVTSRSIMHRMNFGGRRGVEYTINLYRGCTHGCVYCYAPSLVHDDRTWGEFVDAKVNAPAILQRELRGSTKAPVFLSSASDPYQPVEARYKLTRRCLEQLHASAFPVVILTRSPLVLRDIELLCKMEWVRVGCSISTASGRVFEPGVPPVERRLETLRELARVGIRTWVSLAPVIPGIMTFEIEELLSRLHDAGVETVTPGLLRFQGYEESKEMFEGSTGMAAETALRDGAEVIDRVRKAVAKAGFRSPEEFFRWEEHPHGPRLDEFVDRPEAGSGATTIRTSALPAGPRSGSTEAVSTLLRSPRQS